MPEVSRAATKAGKSKDAVTKDNKQHPIMANASLMTKMCTLEEEMGEAPSLILTTTGATLEAAETKEQDDTNYKNGDSTKKCKVFPSLNDMEVDESRIKESTHNNHQTNKKNITIDITENKSAGKADASDDEGVNSDNNDVKEASCLFEDAGKVVARAFFEKN
eukprot:15346471-Ditylum_brightwellii.AAC.1